MNKTTTISMSKTYYLTKIFVTDWMSAFNFLKSVGIDLVWLDDQKEADNFLQELAIGQQELNRSHWRLSQHKSNRFDHDSHGVMASPIMTEKPKISCLWCLTTENLVSMMLIATDRCISLCAKKWKLYQEALIRIWHLPLTRR